MGGGVKWEIILGGVGGLASVFAMLRLLLNAADTRSDERIRMFLSNGGGELLEARVKAGVLSALNEHQINCPMKDRLSVVEERLTTIERAA